MQTSYNKRKKLLDYQSQQLLKIKLENFF